MNEDVEVLKQYVESLGLHEKTTVTLADISDLCRALKNADETVLADYVKQMDTPKELQELITNTLYG